MSAPETNLRAADSDRERAVELLRHHHDAGRLDHDDLEERVQAVYRARTYGDLDALFSDLPSLAGPAPSHPVPVAVTPVNPPVRITTGRAFRHDGIIGVAPARAAEELLDELKPTLGGNMAIASVTPGRIVLAGRRVPLWTWPVALVTFPIGLAAFFARSTEQVTIDLEPTGDGRTRVAAYGIGPKPVRHHLRDLLR